MTIYRINPDLLKPEGASDGDVVTYVSANSRVEWAAPSGGGGDVANAWVNANDHATYTSITANVNSVNSNVDSIAANLYNTYTTLNANDYNSYTALTANVYNTLLDTRANDYNSYTTLTANIYNTFAYLNANVGGGGGGDVSNTWVNANDYTTFTTLTANIYNTFAYLNANVGSGGGGGSTLANLVSDQYIVSSSNTFTLTQTVIDANNIIVSVDGVIQNPNDDYTVFGTTLSLNNTIPIPAGISVEVRHLGSGLGGGGDASNTWLNANDYNSYTTLVGLINTVQNNVASGGGGITTGKAVAMAIIFGG